MEKDQKQSNPPFQKSRMPSRRHLDWTEAEKTEMRNMISSIRYVQDSYSQAVLSNPELKQKDYIEFIERNLAHECYQTGQPICHVGDAGKSMFIILDGVVGVAVPISEQEVKEREKKVESLMASTKKSIEKKNQKLGLFLKKCLQKAKEKLPKSVHRLIDQLGETTGAEDDLMRVLYNVVPLKKYQEMGYSQDDILLLGLGRPDLYYAHGVIKFRKVAEKKQGDIVGEQALANDQPRNATLLALGNVHLASLSKTLFERLFKSKIEDEKTKMRFFKQVFAHISQKTISKCMNYFHNKTVLMNQVLFRAGEPVKEVFLIYSGEVDLIKNIQYQITHAEFPETLAPHLRNKGLLNRRSQDVKISRLVAGEFIGVEDLQMVSGSGRRSCTAIGARASSAIFSLSIGDFLKMEQSSEKVICEAIKSRARLKIERNREINDSEIVRPFLNFNQKVYEIHNEDNCNDFSTKGRIEKEAEAKSIMKNLDTRALEAHPLVPTILQEADAIWNLNKEKKEQKKLYQINSLPTPTKKKVEAVAANSAKTSQRTIQVKNAQEEEENKQVEQNEKRQKEARVKLSVLPRRRASGFVSVSRASSPSINPFLSTFRSPEHKAEKKKQEMLGVKSLDQIQTLQTADFTQSQPQSPNMKSLKDLVMNSQFFSSQKKINQAHLKGPNGSIEVRRESHSVVNGIGPNSPKPQSFRLQRPRAKSFGEKNLQGLLSPKTTLNSSNKDNKEEQIKPKNFGILPRSFTKTAGFSMNGTGKSFYSSKKTNNFSSIASQNQHSSLPFPFESPLFTMKENKRTALIDLTGKYLLNKYFKPN